MKIGFGESPQSTLGVEWELAIVDLATLEQVPAAHYVLDGVEDPVNGPIRGEYLQSMIELVSGVHHTVAGVLEDLSRLLHHVIEVLEPHGCTVLAMGAHPFGDPTEQPPVKKAQYRRVRERNGWWGELMVINGLHIHTGVASRDKALPMTYGLARFIPYFIALSASSPFWLGIDTRFASQRTMLFQQLPTNGLPYHMTSWQEYEKYASELEGVGLIQNPSEIRWDVRPSTFGTVENRSMDCVPTLMEIGALAALSQTLVERMSRELDAGGAIDRLPFWFMRENKWRAARYGMGAEVITPRPEEHTIMIREGLRRWLEELAPTAAELGCAANLEDCARLAAGGPSYVRQRRVHAETGDLGAVVRSVIAETMQGRPRFEGPQ
ncbi:YbdK family carboxylate-amine ligase [Tessaracoccus sp. OS52]|uniref:carboxylate-amine ligase n=1 Tax=Tessaracoccus sp. OS52 TaxID=2886691 RepID=UPI001D109FE7|nr:YbdK family carboxylate-amine ligase [Tessaracoccus sp. OS52]MCC2593111.1 YbdK family carboxylate-amine ligase [Tessaracoccus sp. OS52]